MRNLRLKVCGLRDNIGEVAALGPNYAGFIFYKKSPRYVGDDFVMLELNSEIKKVGVFVNESLEKIHELVLKHELDLVQLHGTESPKLCSELKDRGVGVVKAFPVSDDFDFEILEKYNAVVDFFLFDTKTKDFGGSGKTFNWELLKKYAMEKKYFLSGGIGLDNIKELDELDLNRVHALDVNSKFEIAPGLKDAALLKALIARMD